MIELINKPKIYSETYSILNELGYDYIEKIPKEIYQTINNLRDENYNPKYNLNVSLKRQGVSRRTIALICSFHIRYWVNNIEEKRKIKEILDNNAEENTDKPLNIFDSDIESSNEGDSNNKLIIYKENIFNKILLKLIGL